MKLRILSVVAALLVAACAGIPNEEAFKAKVSAWMGRDAGDLVKAWGQPNGSLPTAGGGMVYTYNKGKPVASSCIVEFVVDASHKVTAWRYSGSTCRTVY